jgi:MFS family permease
MALLGLGNGPAIPAMIAAVLRVVPRATSGTAAGVLTTTQQISMAFGVAIFGSVQAVVISLETPPAGLSHRTSGHAPHRRGVARAGRGRFHIAVSEATSQLKSVVTVVGKHRGLRCSKRISNPLTE